MLLVLPCPIPTLSTSVQKTPSQGNVSENQHQLALHVASFSSH